MVRPRRQLNHHRYLEIGQVAHIDTSLYINQYDKESHHYILRPEIDDDRQFTKDIYYPANSKYFNYKKKPKFFYVLNSNIGLHPQTIEGHGRDFFMPKLTKNFDKTGEIFWKHMGEGRPFSYDDFNNSEDGKKSFTSATDSHKEWTGVEECEKLLAHTIKPYTIKGTIVRIFYTYHTSNSISDRPSDKASVCYVNDLSVDLSEGYPQVAGFDENRKDWLENHSIVVLKIDEDWEIHVPFSIVKPSPKVDFDYTPHFKNFKTDV